MAQLVKNLPAMQETWVQSLGWEDPLEKGMATHGVTKSWTRLSDLLLTYCRKVRASIFLNFIPMVRSAPHICRPWMKVQIETHKPYA